MATVTSHGGVVRPLRTLCTSLGVAPATYYRKLPLKGHSVS